MIKLQVVGMPLKTHRRLRPEFDKWVPTVAQDLSVRLLPSSHETIPRIDSSEFHQIQSNIQDGFVHIAIVPSRNQRDAQIRFRFDCRVINLNLSSDCQHITWQEFQDAISESLIYEKKWCTIARPNDTNHPLLLPRPSFEPELSVGDFWRQCDCYREAALLLEANNALQRVKSLHKRIPHGQSSFWEDSRRREFRVDPSRHGLAPEQRRGLKKFRFCFEVPRGFHYDVVHASGARFSLTGREEQVYRDINRANVDPWGTVRIPLSRS
jgi:hypothetical protein